MALTDGQYSYTVRVPFLPFDVQKPKNKEIGYFKEELFINYLISCL